MPLGHVPGVRPKGLRASSRLPLSSSAPISLSRARALFFSSTCPSALSSSFSLAPSAPLCKAERFRRRKMAETEGCALVGSRGGGRKGSSHFAHFTLRVHVHLRVRSSYREQRDSRVRFSDLDPDARNVGLTSKPRLTTKSLGKFMRHSSRRRFL